MYFLQSQYKLQQNQREVFSSNDGLFSMETEMLTFTYCKPLSSTNKIPYFLLDLPKKLRTNKAPDGSNAFCSHSHIYSTLFTHWCRRRSPPRPSPPSPSDPCDAWPQPAGPCSGSPDPLWRASASPPPSSGSPFS